jgi:hypothetical protein
MAMQRLQTPYACAAKRSLVDMGYAVIFASTDGLVRFANDGPTLITQGLVTPTQWRSYVPASMHACRLDEYYLVFYDTGTDTGAMIVPVSGEWVVFLDLYATASYTDPSDGTLYLVQNGDALKSFNTAAALTARWRSGIRVMPRPINIGGGRVDADSYPVTFRLIADGSVKATITVGDEQPFVLPGGYRGQRYAVEVEGGVRVRRIEVAESIRELARQ